MPTAYFLAKQNWVKKYLWILFYISLFHSYTYNTAIQVFHNDSVRIAACADPLATEVPEIQIRSEEDDKGKIAELQPNGHMDVFMNTIWQTSTLHYC